MGDYPSNIQAGGDGHKRQVCCIFLNYVDKTLKHNKLYNTLNYL